MPFTPAARALIVVSLTASLSACGGGGSGLGNIFGGPRTGIPTQAQADQRARADEQRANLARIQGTDRRRSTIWDLFSNSDDPNTTVEVNKYLWNASLDVLNFLPIQSVDPFTGVIVTGYGTPPGGGRSYRATIYVQDPALDARSLKVSLVGQGNQPVAPEVARAVEDAILTRARELRVQDTKL
jgi:Domain of unknown function (DUF3576)